MTQEVNIVIDDREARCNVLDALCAIDGVTVQVERLAAGDYEVDDRLLVERKTLPDLVQSIKDGRLFRQAYRLVESPLKSLVILEGSSESLKSSGMHREAIQGALITLTLYFGIPLLRSRDPCETALLMIYAARQGRAMAEGGLPRKGRRPRGKLRTQLHILQGLPGIGPRRARLLLDSFGSVEAVFSASEEALQSVEGMGKATVKRIRWAVREQGGVYG